MPTKSLDRYITVAPGIAEGKPRIAEHRITVQNIVIWHEWLGWSADEIAAEYQLSLSEIYAALAYYYEYKEEIDQSIKQDDAFAEELQQKIPSKISQKLNA